jgi:hypothetical protein
MTLVSERNLRGNKWFPSSGGSREDMAGRERAALPPDNPDEKDQNPNKSKEKREPDAIVRHEQMLSYFCR